MVPTRSKVSVTSAARDQTAVGLLCLLYIVHVYLSIHYLILFNNDSLYVSTRRIKIIIIIIELKIIIYTDDTGFPMAIKY